MNKKSSISIIVAMYNEEQVFSELFSELTKCLSAIDVKYEIICVDDGSTDATRALLSQKVSEDPNVKAVFLSRNFGKEAAMTAALDHAEGDAVIPMDADLQDPPELLADMVKQWRDGYDVVFAKRVSRQSDSRAKRNTAAWFYKVFNVVSEINIPENVGDFRLMDRKVVDAIKRLPEKERFMKGLYSWPGFKSVAIEYQRRERVSGESKFNYWKLWNFALNGITSFSSTPIRLGVYLGLIISICAFIYGVVIVVKTLVSGIDVPGYASLMVAFLFMGGVQLFFLGLLGEYIGRIYIEVKNRPIYIVDETVGFEKAKQLTDKI